MNITTPIFSRDGGATVLPSDRLSDVFYRHVGTGHHIIRSLGHQLESDAEQELTLGIIALCGQRTKRTAVHNLERNARAKSVRSGRRILAGLRAQAQQELRRETETHP